MNKIIRIMLSLTFLSVLGSAHASWVQEESSKVKNVISYKEKGSGNQLMSVSCVGKLLSVNVNTPKIVPNQDKISGFIDLNEQVGDPIKVTLTNKNSVSVIYQYEGGGKGQNRHLSRVVNALKEGEFITFKYIATDEVKDIKIGTEGFKAAFEKLMSGSCLL